MAAHVARLPSALTLRRLRRRDPHHRFGCPAQLWDSRRQLYDKPPSLLGDPQAVRPRLSPREKVKWGHSPADENTNAGNLRRCELIAKRTHRRKKPKNTQKKSHNTRKHAKADNPSIENNHKTVKVFFFDF
jgi:hypothetical protein